MLFKNPIQNMIVSYTIKQNQVLMVRPIYLGFAVLDLSKLLMYETYYDKNNLFWREKYPIPLYGY